ncbi:MAG: hypothetical protein KA521_04265 [Crocinitomicaceae bacterium]|nr:hypothetical protein [Crocinitomicaceae bacterium]
MRHIKDIPHERFKIQLMNYNAKYILKIEIDQFEQLYKIGELEVTSLDAIERMVTPEFLKNCLNRFIEMRNDWQAAFQTS